MIIVKPSVEEIVEADILKKIEYIGRTCYKSEDKITDSSAKKFVASLIKSQHYAMLEHAVFTFCLDMSLLYSDIAECRMPSRYYHISILTESEAGSNEDVRLIISANLRTLIEGEGHIHSVMRTILCENHLDVAELLSDDYGHEVEPAGYEVTDLSLLPDRIRDVHSFKSFKFVTDRGVSHEFVRHRDASFAQESTRYCDYSKDKLGNAVTFAEPADFWTMWTDDQRQVISDCWSSCENSYMTGLQCGLKPQQARTALSNGVKTELVVTTNEAEWHHIGNLRYRGTTGAPHPDMKLLMSELVKIYPTL